MKSVEDNTHAFVVCVWLEPRELEGAASEWRGVIEHVLSGERRFLRDLSEISSFVAPYLEEMGVKFTRVEQALRRLKLCWLGILRRD